ncbi:Glucosidase II beta subunit-like [Carpediemonas membranifera]|uniref:Glucosidase 2 subunit beta n=1 Tax=Carpediemonas membranifera TaxID=201153 RepID=A0A8J6BYI2_9EUKA|nr:Glucosidase II beta subunit-like [Carpediemonas membranifera]|eukprot:KAG9394521.1 Glucosidase II beta subunit-like [Carpediemonas membranifera]
MGVTARIAVLFVIFSLVFSYTIRGLSPDAPIEAYDPSQANFTCLDGSRTIPMAWVNDDYCDCPDGSDEPGTSACTGNLFFCSNIGSRSKYIHSSFVDDGRCDCCDGSDEVAGLCPNTCAEEAAQFIAQYDFRVKEVEEGIAARRRMEATVELDAEWDQLEEWFVLNCGDSEETDEEWTDSCHATELLLEHRSTAPSLIVLYNTTLESDPYTVHLFQNASVASSDGQRTHSLGVFSALVEKGSTLLFLDGAPCGADHGRSLRLALTCGPSTVVQVSRIGTCEYEGTLYTPAVCDESTLKEAQQLLEDLIEEISEGRLALDEGDDGNEMKEEGGKGKQKEPVEVEDIAHDEL